MGKDQTEYNNPYIDNDQVYKYKVNWINPYMDNGQGSNELNS